TVLEVFESSLGEQGQGGGNAPAIASASADASDVLDAAVDTPLPNRSARSHGDVHVVSRVVGFKKIRFYTNENVGSGDLDLPEQQMHTTAYWLTIPRAVLL